MTIDEAIKNLTQWRKDLQRDKLPNYYDSLGLGIEALKLELKNRGTLRPGLYPLLPGETEE